MVPGYQSQGRVRAEGAELIGKKGATVWRNSDLQHSGSRETPISRVQTGGGSYLSNNPGGVANDARAGRNVPGDECAGLDERAFADANPFEDGGVRSDPNVVLDDDGKFYYWRTGPALANRDTGDRISDSLGRTDGMKIAVGDGDVPAEDDVASDSHLEFAHEHGVCEVAVIANGHAGGVVKGELGSIHGAVPADDQGVVDFAVKALKSGFAFDDRVFADPHIPGQFTLQPWASDNFGAV